MSYDEQAIKNELKKHIPKGYDVDLNEVLKTVEIVNGMYVFTMLTDGFAFIGNYLVDVMPGWKKTDEVRR